MFTATRQRVPLNTDEDINRRIAREIDHSIEYHAARPSKIPRRLRQLDEEWDIERVLEANASVFVLVGIALGMTRGRPWLLLSAGVAGFLLQHAVEGWCPPLPVLRRLGFRTMQEIDRERSALRLLRGDFDGADIATRASAAKSFSLPDS